MNKLPIEINSEMKIFGFSLSILVFAAVGMFFGTQTKNWIYAPLQTPWIIFNTVVWLFLGLPSPVNRGKKIFTSIVLFLTRDDKTYISIPAPIDVTELEVLKENKELNEEIINRYRMVRKG